MTSSVRYKPAFIAFAIFFAIYSVFWYLNNPRLLVLLTIVACLILIIALGSAFARESDRLKSEWVFLALLVSFSILFCFIFPPYTVPDEGHHFFSTYWLVDSLPFNGRVIDSDTFLVRDIDLSLYKGPLTSTTINSASFSSIFQNFSLFGNGKLIPFSEYSFSVGSENVIAKIGSVIGLQIGLSLGLGAFPAFYMGRIGSALFFCFCAFFAYRIAPRGKPVIVFVSLLPMTLHLAASYSYDSGIIAYSLILFACLMRGFFGEQRSVGYKEIIFYLVISAFLAPCKVIYSGLVLLGLFVPLSKFQDERTGRYSKLILVLAVIVSVLALRIASMSRLVSQPSGVTRGMDAAQYYTLNDIILHPRNSFLVFFRTLDSLGDFYWETTLGYSLGWFQENLRFPAFYMIPYLLLGFICCLDSEDEPSFLSPSCSILFIISFALAALGSIASMWLGWTFNYEKVIQGVQGRYFLPALPALLFGLRTRLFSFHSSAIVTITLGISLMNCLYLIRFISIATCM
ncbi:DUF2142 domain-containing protein [Collinsella sp. HCP3S3_B8]|uniref:DUF2142 domain-containing protein n=1 Tax=Collinsella sp. HCP3S3_B8 TaxID=3438933 RepID=UPI003F8ADA52